MANPWTRKNPFLSLWLSAANAAAGRARAQTTAAAARQRKAAVRSWTGLWLGAPKSKRRR